MKTKLNALSAWLDRHALPLGAALAAALSMLLALYNVGVGPLGNLNDIGGWRNRALYIALTAAVQLFVLLAAALLYHERFWRLAVRQLLLTVGLVILLMGINHKSYLFVEQMLPFIRRMDAAGLSAMNDMRLNLSAPAVTALYLLTRGPIYDMYMIKLACMGAFLLMAGEPGMRLALPNSEVMIHQPSGGASGQATDVQLHAQWLLRTKGKMNKLMSEMTHQPLERIERDVERDYFMTAEEALAYGIIDEIYQPRKK